MADDDAPLQLPATSWAVLGLLSFGEELSGYDLKKWADASLRYFYWSPSFSQIYAELRRLEGAGCVTSRLVEPEAGARPKRLYRITDAGLGAVRVWAREAPVDPPMLKHPPLLRLWLGHLAQPDRLRRTLEDHRADAEGLRARAAADLARAADEPGWAYPLLALKWSERYYAAQAELMEGLRVDLDAMLAARAGEDPSH
ncbi:PadR family transcriptional regulator [Streptacidiphilus jiangxiensis]|uniref:DNA-binding transcriptional regulator, PadR family n=1 Tax=Streptacidiphilus jiangxiensis TaxID=235985 RepID=A0A1H7V5U3_STRJI|nr:PadR family transcriptional regulator [Streptacidiphilus jiangxiensis]SEM04429.1 DNA-binding transcriptional regulator, PadR family [Streptacidiphilus jiangxiensis]